MEKKELEEMTNKELNSLLEKRGMNLLAYEDRKTAISLLSQI